eukprot:5272026-Prymnesium_polylepis.1
MSPVSAAAQATGAPLRSSVRDVVARHTSVVPAPRGARGPAVDACRKCGSRVTGDAEGGGVRTQCPRCVPSRAKGSSLARRGV